MAQFEVKQPLKGRHLGLFLIFIYFLFIYLAASDLSCSTQDLHCVMWELSFWQMDSLVVAQGLQSRRVSQLQHGLSCSATCGGLSSPSRDLTESPALQGGFLSTGQQGKSETIHISFMDFYRYMDLWIFLQCNKIGTEQNGLPRWLQKQSLPANAGDKRCGFDPWVRKIPWRRAWQPTPIFLPGESHGQGSLAGLQRTIFIVQPHFFFKSTIMFTYKKVWRTNYSV